jgi:hypothetical protein
MSRYHDPRSWGRRIGRSWVGQLTRCHLDRSSTLVEIGPGFSAKVGFALAELNFEGSLILIEPNEPARRWAAEKYGGLLPGANVRTVPCPVPEAGPLAGITVDLLLGNHILDDLLLNAYVESADVDRIFGGMYPDAGCSEKFIAIWRQLSGAGETVARLVDDVVDGLAGYVNAVRPGCLILNEYASWQHSRCGLDIIHQVSLRAMGRLQERLARDRPGALPPPLSRDGSMFWLSYEIPQGRRTHAALNYAG